MTEITVRSIDREYETAKRKITILSRILSRIQILSMTLNHYTHTRIALHAVNFVVTHNLQKAYDYVNKTSTSFMNVKIE